ncbi:MAG: hypothetical protein P8X42_17305 [Calditrichaceae bacterium]
MKTFIFLLNYLLLFTIISCEPLCGNDIIYTKTITGTKYKIVVFQRDCGATTGFSTQASIIEKNGKLPNESGNIFIADTDHGKAPRGPGGGPELQVKIINGKLIRFSYHENARVFLKKKLFGEIKIEYKTTKQIEHL